MHALGVVVECVYVTRWRVFSWPEVSSQITHDPCFGSAPSLGCRRLDRQERVLRCQRVRIQSGRAGIEHGKNGCDGEDSETHVDVVHRRRDRDYQLQPDESLFPLLCVSHRRHERRRADRRRDWREFGGLHVDLRQSSVVQWSKKH